MGIFEDGRKNPRKSAIHAENWECPNASLETLSLFIHQKTVQPKCNDLRKKYETTTTTGCPYESSMNATWQPQPHHLSPAPNKRRMGSKAFDDSLPAIIHIPHVIHAIKYMRSASQPCVGLRSFVLFPSIPMLKVHHRASQVPPLCTCHLSPETPEPSLTH